MGERLGRGLEGGAFHFFQGNTRPRVAFDTRPRIALLIPLVQGLNPPKDPKLPPQKEDQDLQIPSLSPGKILLEEFLDPLGISLPDFAERVRMPYGSVQEIFHGKRRIGPDAAARFSLFFGNSAKFWLNLQAAHDARAAEELVSRLREEISPWSHGSPKESLRGTLKTTPK